MTKYVYFMRAIDGSGPIKIGCTQDLMMRLYDVSLKRGAQIGFLAFAEGSHDLENRIQRGFNHLRVEGEWFDPAPELMDFIEQTVRSQKLPEPHYDERTKKMAQMYFGGATLQQIGDEFDMSRERVRQILRRDDVPSLGHREKGGAVRKFTPQQGRDMRRMHQENASMADIARHFDCSVTCVKMYLIEQGVTDFKKGPRKSTIAKAEVAARLYADGIKTPAIAKELGLPQPSVYRLLKIAGVKPDRRAA